MRKIPKDCYIKPPDAEQLPPTVLVVITDAGYKNGVVGICVRLRASDRKYSDSKYERRAKGPVHAELKAVKAALQRVKKLKRRFKKVLVYTDSTSAHNFLTGKWPAKKPHIRDTLQDIRKLEKEIEGEIEYIHVKGKYIKAVDKKAGKIRKREEKRVAERIAKRKEKVERCIAEGRKMHVEIVNGDYRVWPKAGGGPPGYKVELDPPSCECPWWQNKWANKPLYVQKARALPCKHICAVAEYLGRDIFKIFEKAINRND